MFSYTRVKERDNHHPKKIAVVGDTMLDEWFISSEFVSQDGCLSVRWQDCRLEPGGAAGVARQLQNWDSQAVLLGPVSPELADTLLETQVEEYPNCAADQVTFKSRYVTATGKILFRADYEADNYDLTGRELDAMRSRVLDGLAKSKWHAILLVDYDKGFLSDDFIKEVIAIALRRNILVIADPKRPPTPFAGALLKINLGYFMRHKEFFDRSDWPLVRTRGDECPQVHLRDGAKVLQPPLLPVSCRNHVGAGDCFLAHLALGLLHGLSCEEAALFAHHAGRVYVQHLFGQPPSIEEIIEDQELSLGRESEKAV